MHQEIDDSRESEEKTLEAHSRIPSQAVAQEGLEQTSFPERDVRKTPFEKLQEFSSFEVRATVNDGYIDVEFRGIHPEKGSCNAGVTCRKSMSERFMYVDSSGAGGGAGPIAYDIAMELASQQDLLLTSCRGRVSDEAFAVWKYYKDNRPDVERVELPVEDWYLGNHTEGPEFEAMTEDRSTWPDSNHPIWALWSGYRKDAEIITALEKTGQIEIDDRR